jgi:hypothetical protein
MVYNRQRYALNDSSLCHQAALRAIRRAVHAGEGPVGSHIKVSIEAADLEAAMQNIRAVSELA